MKHFKFQIIILSLTLLLNSCIKEFYPELNADDTNNYVISGELTNLEGFQCIYVSQASALAELEYIPASGCLVTVYSKDNQVYTYNDNGNGEYIRYFAENTIVAGNEYFLEIKTPDGKTYISDSEKMLSSGNIDSVKFGIESKLIFNTDPFQYSEGVQFYVDGSNANEEAIYYKWNLSETWEYRVEQPIRWYYVGYVVHVFPADYSRMVCWRTLNIGDIFLATTEFLSKNEYQKASLHFVDNNSQRLKYLYSLEVTQLSINEKTYTYWQRLKNNNTQSGGLYTMQPADIQGNIHNANNENEKVLGYFTVAGAAQKRIFVDKQKDIPLLKMDDVGCDTIRLERAGFREIDKRMYPAYLVGDDLRYSMAILTEPCVDCLQMGGDTVRPVFWPEIFK